MRGRAEQHRLAFIVGPSSWVLHLGSSPMKQAHLLTQDDFHRTSQSHQKQPRQGADQLDQSAQGLPNERRAGGV